MSGAKASIPNLSGQTFGRWMVLNDFVEINKERKWLCQCSCSNGTKRYVLERSLKSGGSLSCGCLRKENLHKAISYDLTGKRFGDLTVIGRSARENASRGLWWKCQCSCGSTYDVLGTLLVTGKRTHCGCKTARNTHISDITGQVFGRLTALFSTEERSKSGSVMWHCRCQCGKELDLDYNRLLYSAVKSCGCQKREHDQKLQSYLNHIDGTSLEMLGSTKVPTNSTTGHKGVYHIQGKYIARIVFQQKAYYLGTYANIQDAITARKDAEEAVFEPALAFYTAWKEKAAQDPQWAENNPASVSVLRDPNGRLYVQTMPRLAL